MIKSGSSSKMIVSTGKPGENERLRLIHINNKLARIENEAENNPRLTYP